MAGLLNYVNGRHGIPTPIQNIPNIASPPAADSRRQAAAAQARLPTPVTSLVHRPSPSASERPETRSHGPLQHSYYKPEDRERIKQEHFDNQNQSDDLFGTDFEGVDESTTLSDLQVKDSQAEGQDRGYAPDNQEHGYADENGEYGAEEGAGEQADEHADRELGSNEESIEGSELEEQSGSEDEDASDFEAGPAEDDSRIISNDISEKLLLNSAVRKMRFEQSQQASSLPDRPKARSRIDQPQLSKIPTLASEHYPNAKHRRASGNGQNGGRGRNGSYPITTSGESDTEYENDDNTIHPTRGSKDKRSRQPNGRKLRKSHSRVDRVPRTAQPHDSPRQAPQKPQKEDVPRPVKRSQSSAPQTLEPHPEEQHAERNNTQAGSNVNQVDPIDNLHPDPGITNEDTNIDEPHNEPTHSTPPPLFQTHPLSLIHI